jgi:hypothetical protein
MTLLHTVPSRIGLELGPVMATLHFLDDGSQWRVSLTNILRTALSFRVQLDDSKRYPPLCPVLVATAEYRGTPKDSWEGWSELEDEKNVNLTLDGQDNHQWRVVVGPIKCQRADFVSFEISLGEATGTQTRGSKSCCV